MRIKLISADPRARRDLASRGERIDAAMLRPGTLLELHATRNGPAAMGTSYDHTLSELAILDSGMAAQEEGFDAICIDDATDPALDALRSRLDIPVTSAGTGSLWLGRLLGSPTAFIAPEQEARAIEEALSTDRRTAFVIPYADHAPTDRPSLERAVEAVAATALREGAASIALVGAADALAASVSRSTGVPAFAAAMAAVKLAEVLVGLALHASRVAYVKTREVQDDLVTRGLRVDGQAGPSMFRSTSDAWPPRRIKVVVPHSDMDQEAVGRRAEVIRPGLLGDATRVEYTGIASSPNRADSPYASALMDVFCLQGGLLAADEGFDALTVDSTTDSGIQGLRSRLPILVLGTGQATWALAAFLCARFSIVAMEPEWVYFYKKNLRASRLAHMLASVRVVGARTDPYNLFEGKEEEMYRTLEGLGMSAIEEDGAEAIVIGSTTMHQAGDHLAASLPAPVLNPGRIALRTIEALLEMGLLQSRVSSPAPVMTNDQLFA